MLFSLHLGHLTIGFTLVVLNCLVILNNRFVFTFDNIIFALFIVNVLAIIYMLRLASEYESPDGFIAFSSFFVMSHFICLVVYPLDFYPTETDYKHRYKDVILLWILFASFIALLAGSLVSVRRTRALRAEKHYMQRLYSNVIEQLPIPLSVYKAGQKEPIIANTGAKDLVKHEQKAAIQLDDARAEHETLEVVQQYVASLWQKLAQEDKKSGEYLFERHNTMGGALVEVGYGFLEVSNQQETAPLDIRNDHLFIFNTDISERIKLINELTEAKVRAEQSEQAKSQFLANISHELRTPLTSIIGFGQIVRLHEKLDPAIAESIDIITRSSEHLLLLVNDILDLSKAEANSLSLQENDVNISTLIYEEKGNFALQAEEKYLGFQVDSSLSLPQMLRLDEGKVRQVLRNLLSNAIKFTTEGQVTILIWSSHILDATLPLNFLCLPAEHIRELQKVTAALPVPEDATENTVMLHIQVQDTGIGIAPDELATIFEPFTQSRSGVMSHKGTGLGLAISKRYAQFLGGDLQIESQEGRGTLCHFYIPVQEIARGREQGNNANT